MPLSADLHTVCEVVKMASGSDDAAPPDGRATSPRPLAFVLVCVAYLATTTGESLLAPIYPTAAADLGLDLAGAGVAFAVLAFSIAAANLVAGALLRWYRANHVIAAALGASAIGGVLAATADASWQFLVAQVALGAGAGLLYPPAIMSVGTFAGSQRRGFAMAVFGVFFSGGLTLAAGLAALGSRFDWRVSFAIGAALAVVAALGVWPIADAPRSDATGRLFSGLREVLGVPTVVGVVGGVSQYATVSFFPVFAVTVWGLSDARAAACLAIGRVLSIPAKLVSGVLADRAGAVQAARLSGLALGALGAVWALAPAVPVAVIGGIFFTAGVSGLFPLANLLAFERVGRRGGALGAFRSVQLGAGAVAGFLVGGAADWFGLRPTVAVAAMLPVCLLLLTAPAAQQVAVDRVRSG
jgi:DHA1 family purine base/nucleoside efflux pump-like MFS transporter